MKEKILTNAERNRRGFDPTDCYPMCGTGTSQIRNTSLEWEKEVRTAMDQKEKTANTDTALIRLVRPLRPWIKLNTNGAVLKDNNHAAIGGVFRDSDRKWLLGYTRNIGRCEVVQKEAWGILDGLTLAWSRNLKNIIVENDNQQVIEWINSTDDRGCNNIPIDNIRTLRDRDWNVIFQHVYRETNSVADRLAKRALNDPVGIFIHQEIPSDILRTASLDQKGKAYKRPNSQMNV